MLAEARSRALEAQARASDLSLERIRDEARAAKRKRTEGEHYRALLHDLRSRWYLRPFIPGHRLRVEPSNFSEAWLYRGRHFEPPAASSPSHRRRILIVGHLLSKSLFGSEKSLLEIIAVIDPAKFDVFAVFPERNDEVFARLQSQVQGIGVFDFVWWRKDRPFCEETVAMFERIYRELAIDLVHANTIMVSDPLLAARRAGIPAITNARELISCDDELAERLGAGAAEITQRVCENASYLLANSAATLADYPCGSRGSYLYNYIDAEAFDFPNPINPDCIKIGLISSNIVKKGTFDFLDLAARAEQLIPALQFHLIGPQNHLISGLLSDARQLPANFHYRGYASHPTEAFGELNLVLNLSRFAESFGRTVAEAMIARRPVIGYRHGALPELIDDGETGFLVPYLDLTAVFERLRFFAANPQKITQFGELARERSRQRFSREKCRRGINALYERLIADTRAAG